MLFSTTVSAQEKKTDLERNHLKGKVKSVKTYQAKQKFGELQKEIQVYTEYDSNGNEIENIKTIGEADIFRSGTITEYEYYE